ncbi:MAG: hypothetical protein JW908_13840 [Anaerolineales bacterium]|nr:hypothetical protein [Anaerolineales bacterium]
MTADLVSEFQENIAQVRRMSAGQSQACPEAFERLNARNVGRSQLMASFSASFFAQRLTARPTRAGWVVPVPRQLDPRPLRKTDWA